MTDEPTPAEEPEPAHDPTPAHRPTPAEEPTPAHRPARTAAGARPGLRAAVAALVGRALATVRGLERDQWKRVGVAAGVLAVIVAATAVVVPGAASADIGPFESDDFNDVQIDPNIWNVVNPAGDGQVSMQGAGTGDARMVLSVPGGASHDAWTTNKSLRVVQEVENGDFDVVAKFDSTPAARYQMQGFLVQEAGGGYLRYSLQHVGTSLRLYAASISSSAIVRLDIGVGGTSAAALRVKRAGDLFTLYYSADGLTWTTATSFAQAMDVNGVGLFAGNHQTGGSAPPAFNAIVDYAFNTASPISPEDGAVTPPDDDTPPAISNVAVDPNATGATVSWTTDDAATSAVAYGPSESLGSSVNDSGFDTGHTLTLSDLEPDTTYHYTVRSTNVAGLESSSEVATFTTDPPPPAGNFVSDDFRNGVSDALWAEVDPVGDGTVSLDESGECEAQASLSVPAGTSHDAWVTNESLRLTQAVGNGDLDITAAFASMPTKVRQSQGIVVEQNETAYVRFGVHYDGSSIRVYGVTFGNGVAVKRFEKKVGADAAKVLRVARTGDSWTLSYSTNGSSWTTATTFQQPLEVTAAGPFAGNSASGSSGAPEFTALVDYAFDTANPIGPEDGGDSCVTHPLTTTVSGNGTVVRSPNAASYAAGADVTLTAVPDAGYHFAGWGGVAGGTENPATVTVEGPTMVTATFQADTTAPVISDVEVTTSGSAATITWTTDDPSNSTVAHGPTSGYENGSRTDAALVTHHFVTVTGLSASTPYHFRVTSTNGVGLSASSADGTFTTAESSAPRIAMFYGDHQTFGARGQPQNWANVLGNVSDPDGIRSLQYSLNGGSQLSLKWGPDLRRIYNAGDFNAEIAYENLNPGINTVVITAVDKAGEVATKEVTVNRVVAQPPSLPYSTDWASASAITDRAQVVDGKWALDPDSDTIRAVEPAYDRTISFGDLSWTNYEVEVSLTAREFAPGAGTAQSGDPLIGIGMRWRGHTLVKNEQPRTLWYPTGAFAWHRWTSGGRYELIGNHDSPIKRFPSPALQLGTTYVFKAQAKTVEGGTEYRFKVWESGAPEPEAWAQTILEADGPASGGVLLVAHHLVADWGDLVVTPLP